jgi:predicted ATPase
MTFWAERNATIPRIECLKVKKYRALYDLELSKIEPMTVLLGPNGSGKSTVFDVFAFLSECFRDGLRKAWDKRGRFKELRTRGAEGAIEFEIKYRESVKPHKTPLITYYLSIDEDNKGFPYVKQEWLAWKRKGKGSSFRFLDFQNGTGTVMTGDMPEENDQKIPETLSSKAMLAVNTLGQSAKNPRVSALRNFISGWYLSCLTADNTKTTTESGPQERLSVTGDNIPNVLQYLKEQHPKRLDEILGVLVKRIPGLEKVETELLHDGRLLLQIKDAPFVQPISSKYTSDGTMKMLSYLTLLYDPEPPQLIGIEEPENQLHPRLLTELAEECLKISGRTQLMITTHSPFFINELTPEQVWVLYRDKNGYSCAKKTADMDGVNDMVRNGAKLGKLWMENFFDVGDPLTNSGGIKKPPTRKL